MTVGADSRVVFLGIGGASNLLNVCQGLLTVSGPEELLRFVADDEVNCKSGFNKSAETEETLRNTDPMVIILLERYMNLPRRFGGRKRTVKSKVLDGDYGRVAQLAEINSHTHNGRNVRSQPDWWWREHLF